MHNLTELWALLALFLSQILDQVGGSERSVAAGLFNFEGHTGTWARRPVPCSTNSRSKKQQQQNAPFPFPGNFYFLGLTRRSRVRFGACYSRSNKLLCVAKHILATGLQNVFKVGSVKFANSLSPPSIVKKVPTGSKSSQWT